MMVMIFGVSVKIIWDIDTFAFIRSIAFNNLMDVYQQHICLTMILGIVFIYFLKVL